MDTKNSIGSETISPPENPEVPEAFEKYLPGEVGQLIADNDAINDEDITTARCWRISTDLNHSISSCPIGNKISCLGLFLDDKCLAGHAVTL